MYLKKLSALIIFTLSLSVVISCELEVPIGEMVRAKQQIAVAKEAGAEKYDPENLKKAEAAQILSHEKMKAEDSDGALKASEEAYRLAKAAADTSWPLLAADTIKEASDIIKTVDDMNAAVFAAEEFSAAEASLRKAEGLRDESNFRDSYYAARGAINSADKAKEISAAEMPSVRDKINVLQSRIDNAAASELSADSSELLTGATSDLNSATESLEAGNIKAAAAGIADAEEKIIQAEKEGRKVSMGKRIAAAESKAADLKSSGGSEFAADELSEADDFISAAKENLSENPEDAAAAITKAENSLSAASEAVLRGKATEKLSAVEQLYDRISERDREESAAADLKTAYSFIQESSDHLSSGRYKESIASSERAESILNSVSVALDRVSGQKDTGDKTAPDDKGDVEPSARTYTVQYRKKNTDCLWRIAAKEYKDARLWPLIYTANKEQIKDPDLIFPGQKLVIPPVPAKKTKTEEPDKNKEAVKPEGEDTEKTDKTDEGA